jgi:hypothetical protein
MTELELTEALITAAMAKADARVCVPGDNRYYPFPYDLSVSLAMGRVWRNHADPIPRHTGQ